MQIILLIKLRFEYHWYSLWTICYTAFTTQCFLKSNLSSSVFLTFSKTSALKEKIQERKPVAVDGDHIKDYLRQLIYPDLWDPGGHIQSLSEISNVIIQRSLKSCADWERVIKKQMLSEKKKWSTRGNTSQLV